MKQLNLPAPLKRGAEWSQGEIRRYLKCCSEPENSTVILLLIQREFARRGYFCSDDQRDEVWSDFCLKLPLRLQGYDPRKGRSVLKYVIVGCVQSAIDRNRVERKRREVIRGMQRTDLELLTTTRGLDIESRLANQLDAQRLKQVMEDELSPSERRVLEAFYLEETTLREIARETGCTPGAAKMRLYRARQRLIQILIDKEIIQKVPRRAR